MKRALYAIAAVAIIAIVTVPPIDGYLVHRWLGNHLKQTNQALQSEGLKMHLAQTGFHGGWADSKAQLELNFNGLAQNDKTQCIALPVNLEHGWPTLLGGQWVAWHGTLTSDGSCDSLEKLGSHKDQQNLAQALAKLRIDGGLGWSGRSRFVVKSPAMTMGGANAGQIGAVKGVFKLAPDPRDITYNIHWDGARLPSGADMPAAWDRIGAVTIKGQQHPYLKHMSTGQFDMQLHGMDLATSVHQQPAHFKLGNIRIQSTSQAKADGIDAQMSMVIAGLNINTADMGSLHLGARATGMNGKDWDPVVDQIMAMRKDGQLALEATPETVLNALPPKIIRHGIKALQNVNFQLQNSYYELGDSRIQAKGQARWPKLAEMDAKTLKTDPKTVMNALDGQLKLTMPATFIHAMSARAATLFTGQKQLTAAQLKAFRKGFENRIDQTLGQLKTQGLITQENPNSPYQLVVNAKAGNVTLNGHPWPQMGGQGSSLPAQ